MTYTVSTDDDRDTIREAVGARVDRDSIRTSDAREVRLQRNARRQARAWDATLTIDEAHPAAHVSTDFDNFEIVVTGDAKPQPVTDYDGRAWDWLVQRCLTIHEVAHIRYTGFADWRDRVDDLANDLKPLANQFQDALEDAAIETQAIQRWSNYEPLLRTLRANYFHDWSPGIKDPEQGGHVYPMVHAISAAIYDLWPRDVYGLNIGVLDALADAGDTAHHFHTDHDRDLFLGDVLPLVEAVVADVLQTPNAGKRNERIIEFVDDVAPYIDQADADGKSQAARDQGGDTAVDGMPADARENHSGDAVRDAEALGDPMGGAAGGSDGDGDQPTPAEIDPDDLQDVADVTVDPETAARAAEEAAGDARAAVGLSEAVMDEVGELQDALAGGDGDVDRFDIPTEVPEPDLSRWGKAQQAAGQLATELAQRLQAERRTEVERHRRRGRFTGRGGAAVRASMGERNVKQRTNRPDEKDYHAAVVLDRSGSMSGSDIRHAERAVAMWTLALEEVGVETMVCDLYGYDLLLSKPFGVASESRPGHLCNGRTAGGTPLSDVLDLVKGRLDRIGGRKFAVVVTDDQPANPDTFGQTVQGTTFPVLGVSITGGDPPDYYDRAVAVDSGDAVAGQLKQLAREVMF